MKEIATLILKQNNQELQRFNFLEGGILLIGRKGFDANIEIDNKTISRKHAKLQYQNGVIYACDENSSNNTFLNGRILDAGVATKLDNRDVLTFGTQSGYSLQVNYNENNKTPVAIKPDPRSHSKKSLSGHIYSFEEADLIELLNTYGEVWVMRSGYGQKALTDNGRVTSIRNLAGINEGNLAIVEIDDSGISRFDQSYFFKKNNQLMVMDLGSSNGTYVNDRRLYQHESMGIQKKDRVLIAGLYLVGFDGINRNLGKELAIKAKGISKVFTKVKTEGMLQIQAEKKVVLKNLSIDIQRGKFVALMGPSGSGKSTLLKTLNFASPSSTGVVYLHGLNLKNNFELLKRRIGYVPQDDIIHEDLTVYQILFYSAKLRMGDHISDVEIEKKIESVLKILMITDKKTNKVSKLSGGQRKRVSIAVELLNNPSILFLDEPTSPLDPETIKIFLECIKTLTEQGTTVIMVTHKPEDLKFVDEVIFLTTQGYLAYHGPAQNALDYFDKKEVVDIYSLLNKTNEVEKWYRDWKNQRSLSNYSENSEHINQRHESLLKQLFWLSKRYANIKISNTINILILLLQPLIIGSLLAIIFYQIQLGTLFLMAISAIWFGVSNAAKEIVGEKLIYSRERMFNLNINMYLLSKLIVLSIIAFVQVLIFVSIVYFKYHDQSIRLDDFTSYLYFMFYLSFSATLLGLFLSSIAKNTEIVMTIVPIVLMPQIMLAGVMNRIDSVGKELLSYLTLGRWGTEGFAHLQDGNLKYQYNAELLKISTDTSVYPPKIDTILVNKASGQHQSLYNPTAEVSDTLLIRLPNGLLKPYLSGSMDTSNTGGAVESLGFYNADFSLFSFCEQTGFSCNLYMITVLNLIMYLLIYFFMKLKDNH